MKRNSIVLLVFIQLAFLSGSIFGKSAFKDTPKLTVVVVIDQFAYHYIPKLKGHFRYGLKDLLKEGVLYQNAYHPHGVPETTPGHHGLSSGTCAKDHGAIANDWLGMDGVNVEYVNDSAFPTLHPDGETVNGCSSRKTRVDNLSDQFMFSSSPACIHKVYSLSLKSYPAVAMAGKLGKAFWLDQINGEFTTSTAYFDKLPDWVEKFNSYALAEKYKDKTWDLMYPENSPAYDFPYIKNYEFAGMKDPMIGKNADKIIPKISPEKYYMFCKVPNSGKVLFKFAQECLEATLNTQSKDKMLLYVSVSNLDLLTHFYGPDCIEPIDLIYHLDKQLQKFMKFLNRHIGEKNYLIVLTADHGIAPIPEIAQKQGFYLAKRIMAQPFVDGVNNKIKNKYGLEKIVLDYEPSCFRLNHAVFDKLEDNAKNDVLKAIKKQVRSVQGIKNVWTFDELANSTFERDQLENFYKMQLYKGRSGDIIIQPEPYCQITKYKTGTSHMTPYDYDTHVPLIIYQKDRFESKKINEKVWIPQLPVTLAKILRVGKPSASTFEALPGLKI